MNEFYIESRILAVMLVFSGHDKFILEKMILSMGSLCRQVMYIRITSGLKKNVHLVFSLQVWVAPRVYNFEKLHCKPYAHSCLKTRAGERARERERERERARAVCIQVENFTLFINVIEYC